MGDITLVKSGTTWPNVYFDNTGYSTEFSIVNDTGELRFEEGVGDTFMRMTKYGHATFDKPVVLSDSSTTHFDIDRPTTACSA